MEAKRRGRKNKDFSKNMEIEERKKSNAQSQLKTRANIIQRVFKQLTECNKNRKLKKLVDPNVMGINMR